MHLSSPQVAASTIADFLLRYSTIYHTMDAVMRLEHHAHMAKLDVRSAFRLCPVLPSEHHLLGMYAVRQLLFPQDPSIRPALSPLLPDRGNGVTRSGTGNRPHPPLVR